MRRFFATLLFILMLGTNLSHASASLNQLERNKKNVVAFYDLFFNQNQPEAAMQRYVGAHYKQHNPLVADGKKGFIAYFQQMQKQFPNKHIYFKKVLADGDFVILHCLQRWPGNADWASIDIFKLNAQGKIIEHWDVLQTIPKKSANPNSMF